MVAAMHIQNENDRTAFGLRTNELRNVAIGFAVAIALIMVAGQITDSGSASGSDTELTDSSAKRFVNIGITVVAADNIVTSAEEQAGFTVTGTGSEAAATITCDYGGVTDTVTSTAAGAFSCEYDHDGTGGTANMGAVADGTITVTASVTAGGTTYTATTFITQDTVVPTVTITASQGSDGFSSNDATLSMTFTLSESSTNFVVGDISAGGGSMSSFSGSGTAYTATFTPTGGDGAKTINIAGGAFTDANTNDNTAATEFNWVYDTTAPTWSSVAFASGDYVNAAEDNNAINLVITTVGAEDDQVATATLNSANYQCTISSNSCTASITASGLQGLTDGTQYTFSVAVSDAPVSYTHLTLPTNREV